jgi:predicted DNA-binding mobile mystery protein A
MNEFRKLQRKQLDQKLMPLRDVVLRTIPRGGWTKAIRRSLGMSAEALGRRIGVSQSAVSQLEASEQNEKITLASLRKLADGLECDLIYAFVPKHSLEDMMRRQADRRARSIVDSVSTSMELEDQPVPPEDRKNQIEALADELLTRPGTGFWDDV